MKEAREGNREKIAVSSPWTRAHLAGDLAFSIFIGDRSGQARLFIQNKEQIRPTFQVVAE